MWVRAITVGVLDRLHEISFYELLMREAALRRMAQAKAADARRLAWMTAALVNGMLRQHPKLETFMWPPVATVLTGASLAAARAHRDKLVAAAEKVLGATVTRAVDAQDAIRAWRASREAA